jgi:nicotinate-nucleotide pyrophosphorylase (carboxylating)
MPVELTASEIRAAVKAALAEDIGGGDVTTLATVPKVQTFKTIMRAREPLVVAGLEIAEATFRRLSSAVKIEYLVHDGTHVARGDNLLRVSGSARAILSAERVALNFVQHLSGIATLTAQFVAAVKGTRAQILDTRKTMPGWRRFEKYAVACGGGRNHRFGLFDMVLIKDNHLAALRNEKQNPVAAAVQLARKKFPKFKVEVAGGKNRQRPREDRGQRRCKPRHCPCDCRQRCGLHFRRCAHAFGQGGGYRFGF